MAFRMARAAVSPPAGRLRSASAARSRAVAVLVVGGVERRRGDAGRRGRRRRALDGRAGRTAARWAGRRGVRETGGAADGGAGARRGARGGAADAGGRRRPRRGASAASAARRSAPRRAGGAGGAPARAPRRRGRVRAALGADGAPSGSPAGAAAGERVAGAGTGAPTAAPTGQVGPARPGGADERRSAGRRAAESPAAAAGSGGRACRTRRSARSARRARRAAGVDLLLHLVELGLRLLGELLGLVEEPHAATVARRPRRGAPVGGRAETGSGIGKACALLCMSAHGSPSASRSPSVAQLELARAERGVGDLVPAHAASPPARPAAPAPRRARRSSARRCCARRRRGSALRACPCASRWSACPGARPRSRSAISPARSRTSSAVRVRLSGATTWMPREPETFANGVSPSSRRISAVTSARLADRGRSRRSSGSRSNTIRSGLSSMSQRAFQMCGVMQFCCASQRSVSASLIIPCTIVAALAARHLAARDPVRRALGQRLLDDDVLGDPLVPAPQVHRAVLAVRDHQLGHARVVLGQVGLGDPVVREQDLVGVGELDLSASASAMRR